MTKSSTPTENKKAKQQNNYAYKIFDYTAIADRLTTVCWKKRQQPN